MARKGRNRTSERPTKANRSEIITATFTQDRNSLPHKPVSKNHVNYCKEKITTQLDKDNTTNRARRGPRDAAKSHVMSTHVSKREYALILEIGELEIELSRGQHRCFHQRRHRGLQGKREDVRKAI